LRDEYDLPHDVVRAVLAEQGDNPWLALQAAQDLAQAVKREAWVETLNAYARCVRIVRSIAERYSVQPNNFTEKAEKELYAAYQQARRNLPADVTLAAVIDTFQKVLVAPINTFFDEVMVMAEAETVRQNRLALLQDIRELMQGYADLSELQGF
jgi:glycyl-tRNA synthetase